MARGINPLPSSSQFSTAPQFLRSTAAALHLRARTADLPDPSIGFTARSRSSPWSPEARRTPASTHPRAPRTEFSPELHAGEFYAPPRLLAAGDPPATLTPCTHPQQHTASIRGDRRPGASPAAPLPRAPHHPRRRSSPPTLLRHAPTVSSLGEHPLVPAMLLR